MDDGRFDALTRVLGSLVDRRAMVRAFAGGALGALGLAVSNAAKAKKKNKKWCKKPKVKCGKKCCPKGQQCFQGRCIVPCSFTKTQTLWTLQGDCTATSRIDFPDGVTLDGDGKTISAPALLAEAVVLAKQAGSGEFTVRDLSIIGSGCASGGMTALSIAGGNGVIDNLTVANFPCGGTGVSSLDATVEIADSTFENLFVGVFPDSSGECSAHDNTLTNVVGGFITFSAPVTLNVTDNTIVGPGPIANFSAGVWYDDNATGEVSGNTISNYFDSDAGDVACGIRIEANAGAVTIGTNTFPDPPGNEQNVCDNRP